MSKASSTKRDDVASTAVRVVPVVIAHAPTWRMDPAHLRASEAAARAAVERSTGGTAVASSVTHAGPAQVATAEYRSGWEAVFGRQVVGEA